MNTPLLSFPWCVLHRLLMTVHVMHLVVEPNGF